MGNTRLITAPAVEPVTLAEARSHLKATQTAEDALIQAWIYAAREHAENFLNRALCTQTWELLLDGFCDEMEIPKPPLQTVGFVKYLDSSGVLQTLDPSYYVVDAPGRRITRAYAAVWPTTYEQVNAVTVRFTAGYGLTAAVPYVIKAAILLLVQYHEGRQAEGSLKDAAEALLDPQRVVRF